MLSQIESAFRAREASEQSALASEERMRRFVADASHELRTPLTSIRGFAELYRQGAVPDPESLDRVMRRVEDEAARMGLLVEDLLLLARLDQQRPLALEPVDLLEVAGDAVHDARVLAPDRTIGLELLGESAPVVLGDESRLRQVVMNLVSNAVTHTPAGTPVAVTLEVTPAEDDGPDRVLLAVTDHGSGPVRGGPRPGVRAVLPGRPVPHPGGRRQRARAVHRGGPGGRARRPGRRPVRARRGQPVPGRAAPAQRVQPVHRLVTGSPSMMTRKSLSTGPSDVPR